VFVHSFSVAQSKVLQLTLINSGQAMLGLPVWLWVILGALVIVTAVARWFYSRYRAMCRTVRDELSRFLESNYSGVQLTWQPQGNLELRAANRGPRIIDMADVYAAVGRLPGMGRDPAGRARIYQQVLETGGPLVLSAHGKRIKPLLIPRQYLNPAIPSPQTPIPNLGLVVVYALDLPGNPRFLLEQDRDELGIEVPELHRLALDNLRKDFPQQLVVDAVAGERGTAFQAEDFFNAARLLLVPEFLQPNQELIALIPHRDILVLLAGSVRQDEGKLRESMRALECGDHPPLLDRPVLVTHSGFEII
jgi:hypothetical protein